MTPRDFVAAMGPYADQVQAKYGISRWAVLTQWADESGWGTSSLAINNHNYAGIKHYSSSAGGLVWANYASVQAFTTDYIATLALSYYTGVRATSGQSVEATLTALGQSPWDAGHYGSPAGINLINIYHSSIQPLSGQAAPTTDVRGLLAPIYSALAGLAHAVGTVLIGPPWASAQGLGAGQFGTPTSLAAGADYLARAAIAIGVSVGGTNVVTTLPASSNDPGQPFYVFRAVFLGLARTAAAMHRPVPMPSWGPAQGVAPGDFGHPPDLASAASYLVHFASGLASGASAGTGTTPPPAGTGGQGGGGTSPTPPPTDTGGGATGGILPPVPPPPGAPGPGVQGVLAAWDALRTYLNVTLPGVEDRIRALTAAVNNTGNPNSRT